MAGIGYAIPVPGMMGEPFFINTADMWKLIRQSRDRMVSTNRSEFGNWSYFRTDNYASVNSQSY